MTTEDILYESRYGEEYAITLEYELQREKEKNIILEERLRNKEVFIAEMKKMQMELEVLSENCRAELLEEREIRENLEKNVIRSQAESIAELEHQIKYLQGLENIKYSSHHDQKVYRNKSATKIVSSYRSPQEEIANYQKNTKRVVAKSQDNLDEKAEVSKNFSERFLQMFTIYHEVDQVNFKKNLKLGWKWIKEVVREWQEKAEIVERIMRYAEQCLKEEGLCQAEQIKSLIGQKEDENKELYD